MTNGPRTDAEVPGFLAELGIPGLVDVHVHFMPDSVLRKVWAYFDGAHEHYGTAWPITYRWPQQQRVDHLKSLGVQAFSTLSYAHRPDMAAWLNTWSAAFSRDVSGAVHSGTFYPEPGVTEYVAAALEQGVRVWKVHVAVGAFSPADRRLDDVWRLIDEAGTPVVIHAGSGPRPGEHTGPQAVAELLARFPSLPLVIAHLGMPEYAAFADLAERHERVMLDTTMVATDFTERICPMPPGYVERLGSLGDRVVLGSDFPNIPYPYAHQLEALARLGLGNEWLRAVLWQNGAHLLGVGEHA